MAKIRHEINLLNSSVAGSTSPVNASERISFTRSRFNGNLTIFFEIVANNTSSSLVGSVRLANNNTTITEVPTISVPISTSSYTIYRSDANQLPDNNDIHVQILSNSTGTTVSAARIVIIQDTGADPIIKSEDQYEIFHQLLDDITTSTPMGAAADVSNYWFYNSSAYDGTVSFEVEAVHVVSNSMYGVTIILQEDDTCARVWTNFATIVSESVATTVTRSRISFNPKPGYNYRLQTLISNSMGTYSIYSSKIIVTQTAQRVAIAEYYNAPVTSDTWGVWGGTTSSAEIGMAFQTTTSGLIDTVRLLLLKNSSPTDGNLIQIYTGVKNFGQAAGLIAGSYPIQASSVSVSPTWVDFTLSGTGVYLGANVTGFIRCFRTGARDTINYLSLVQSGLTYFVGEGYTFGDAVWQKTVPATDFSFMLSGYDFGNPATKFQSEYLLINSAQSTTGSKAYYTTFDTGEWSGVSNTYQSVSSFRRELGVGNLSTLPSLDFIYGFIESTTGVLLSFTSGLNFKQSSTDAIIGYNFRSIDFIRQATVNANQTLTLLGTGNVNSISGALAQSFTASSGYTAIGAIFVVYSGGNLASGERFGYYCDLTTGAITSPVVASGQRVLGSGINNNYYTYFVFMFNSGITFQSGNSSYLRIWKTPNTYDTNNYLRVGFSTQNYTSGHAWFFNSGTTWVPSPNIDLSFGLLTSVGFSSIYSGVIASRILNFGTI